MNLILLSATVWHEVHNFDKLEGYTDSESISPAPTLARVEAVFVWQFAGTCELLLKPSRPKYETNSNPSRIFKKCNRGIFCDEYGILQVNITCDNVTCCTSM
jgi:hypothetical protein